MIVGDVEKRIWHKTSVDKQFRHCCKLGEIDVRMPDQLQSVLMLRKNCYLKTQSDERDHFSHSKA
jgi:hypothetical protein